MDTRENPGRKLSGFTRKEERTLSDYHAEGYLYVHDKTGMEVCFVENEDREQFFSFVVRSLPEDSSGVAHILEHSTLSGSALYPVHDPFMTLDKASVNTYMNAMTYPDKTLYLASSPLEKDFEHLFSVNADAVFHPLLRRETFEQEGVRLVDDGKGGHWEGVVFNEMLGASADHDGIVVRSAVKALFPESCYRFEAGGDPLSIVGLTWEKYREFYAKWYHPSNIRLFVYGRNDIPAILAYLEETYLSSSRRGAALPPPSCVSSAHDERVVSESPKDPEGRDDSLSVVLAWALGKSSDPREVATLDALVDMLLDDPSCPLYKALIDSGLADDISPESGMISDFSSLVFLVGFKGIKRGMEEKARTVILSALASIVREGLGREAIEGTLKNSRFKQKEIPGGIPQGLRILFRGVLGWMDGKGPFETMEVTPALDALEQSLRDDPRYFEHWIERNLIENNRRALVSVVPTEEFLTRQGEALRKAAAKALGPETKAENARFDLFENTPDDEHALASLPRLLPSDLPEAIRPNLYERRMIGDTPVFCRTMFTNGIVYLNLFCDVDDFSEEEVKCLTLYTRQIMTSGMGTMDERRVSLTMKRLFGGFDISTDGGADVRSGESRLFVVVRMKMLREDVAEALSFASAFLQGANMADRRRLEVALAELKGDFVDSVTYNANLFTNIHASSLLRPSMKDSERLIGLEQWFFLSRLEKGNMDSLSRAMASLQRKLCGRNRFSLSFCADDAYALADVSSFLDSFPRKGEEGGGKRKFIPATGHPLHAFSLPSAVNYTSDVIAADRGGDRLQVYEMLLGQMMTGNELWASVRMRGGAYGVSASADFQEGLFTFSSYRDPRIRGTFSDYRHVLELYAEGKAREEEIENARVTFIGSELKPLSPHRECLWASRLFLFRYDDEMRRARRQWLLSCGRREIEEGASRLLSLLDAGDAKTVLCSRAALEASGYGEKAVPLPL